jgi:hypothetical protein
MVQTEFPGTHDVKGIYLLGPSDLEELDQIIAQADKEMRKHYAAQLARKVTEVVEDYARRNITKSKEAIEDEVRNSYSFYQNQRRVSMKCKSEKTISGDTFHDIICTQEIQTEMPIAASVEIQHGSSISLSIKTELDNTFSSYIGVRIGHSGRAFAHRILTAR